MVKLEEVEDEYFGQEQQGDDEDWESDSESDASSTVSSVADETLFDRISALQDIIPPKQRQFLSSSINSTSRWVKTGLTYGGKTLWVVSTSVLLLGLPWALAYSEEQQLIELEREVKMQQSAGDVLAPGAQSEAKPAL